MRARVAWCPEPGEVGFADAIEGLALGVKTMRKGEHARRCAAALSAAALAGSGFVAASCWA